jgi:hypothetical protein
MHSGRGNQVRSAVFVRALRQHGLAGSISRTGVLPRQRRYGILLHPAPKSVLDGPAQAQTCLGFHPNGVTTAHGCRSLVRSMRAPNETAGGCVITFRGAS